MIEFALGFSIAMMLCAAIVRKEFRDSQEITEKWEKLCEKMMNDLEERNRTEEKLIAKLRELQMAERKEK